MSKLPGSLRALHARPRWSRDYYVEPAWCVHALFEAVPFSGPVHDPACGSGTIVHVARALGYEATGSDLVARGFCEGGIDFLADNTPRQTIISNPPFAIAERFIHHALEVAERVAVIVPLAFSAGQRRCRSLFLPHPPALELVLAKRPSMPPGGTDIPAKGGTTDYAWLIWDRGQRGPTVKQWWVPSPPSGRTGSLLSEAELEQDAIESYYAGIDEIGRRVRAGSPVPAFLLPKRSEGAP